MCDPVPAIFHVRERVSRGGPARAGVQLTPRATAAPRGNAAENEKAAREGTA